MVLSIFNIQRGSNRFKIPLLATNRSVPLGYKRIDEAPSFVKCISESFMYLLFISLEEIHGIVPAQF